jgi:hypothetical protein
MAGTHAPATPPEAATESSKQASDWRQAASLIQNSTVQGDVININNVWVLQSRGVPGVQAATAEPPPVFQAVLDVQGDMAQVGLLRQRRRLLQAAVQSGDAVCSVEVQAELRLRLSQAHNDLGETGEADRLAAEAVDILQRDIGDGDEVQ